MAVGIANVTAQQSSVTGTGDRVLDGAVLQNCRTFASAFATGATVKATILDRTTGDTEVGVYILRASPARLEVVSVRLAMGPNASGGPTSPVAFAAGTKDVLCDVQAEDVVDLQKSSGPEFYSVGPIKAYGLPSTLVPIAAGTFSVPAGYMVGHVFVCAEDVLVERAMLGVASAGSVGSVADLVLYEVKIGSGYTLTMGAKTTLSTVSIATTGVKIVTSLSVALSKGQAYFIGLNHNSVSPWNANSASFVPLGARIVRSDTFTGASIYLYSSITSYPAPDPGPAIAPGFDTASIGHKFPVLLWWQ
jgi:hypothetical protein